MRTLFLTIIMLCCTLAGYAQQIDRKAIYGTWRALGVRQDGLLMHVDSIDVFIRSYEKKAQAEIPDFKMATADSIAMIKNINDALKQFTAMKLQFTKKGIVRMKADDTMDWQEEVFSWTEDNNISLKDKGVAMCVLQLNKNKMTLIIGCGKRTQTDNVFYLEKVK